MSTTSPARPEGLPAGAEGPAQGRGFRLTARVFRIETPGELRSLEALGIHLGQGFHLGRPGPAALVCPQPGMRPADRRDPRSVGAPLRPIPRHEAPSRMRVLPPVPPHGRHAAGG